MTDNNTIENQIETQFSEIKTSALNSINEVKTDLDARYSALDEKVEKLFKTAQRFGSGRTEAEETRENCMKSLAKFLRTDNGARVKLNSVPNLAVRNDPVTGNTGTDAQGGYAVPFVLDNEILKKERDLNIMRQICNVISVSSPDTAWNIDLGGATSGWVAETDSRTQTDAPTLDRATITWGEVYAMPQATQYLLDDAAFDVESWYTNSVAEKFADEEESAFLTGNGSKKPKGILGYTFTTDADGSRDLGKIQKISGGLTFDSILSVYYALRQVYRRQGDCAWLMNGATIEALRKIKDEQNRYIWVDNIANGMAGSLLGCPVYESRFMPGASTNGNLCVLFGNFKKAYTIVDRLGLNVIRDPYTVKGQVAFYTSKRVGNVLTDDDAVKALAVSV